MSASPRRRTTVAVLGSGTMGRALSGALVRAGHRVFIASRDEARAEAAAAAVRQAVPGDVRSRIAGDSPSAAVSRSDLAAIATRWEDTREMLGWAGNFGGRILIDATNPESAEGHSLLVGHTTSGAEEIARRAAGARVVKAFNHVYAEVLARGAVFGDRRASVFLCGDDADARRGVSDLVEDLGFSPVDAGALAAARFLEPAAALMVQIVRVVGRDPGSVALALLARPEAS